MLPTSYLPQPTAQHSQATPPSAVSSREWPTLTIYRDGMANLNALATGLFCKSSTTVGLVEPPATKPGRLGKAWQVHGDPAKDGVSLFGRADRVGLLRFRAAAAAKVLFADMPPQVDHLTFVLTPEPSNPKHFRLLPI